MTKVSAATNGTTERKTAAKGVKGKKTLSQRLMQALTGEVRALEKMIAHVKAVEDDFSIETGTMAAGAKARVDAIGNLTRTLQKLLELTRLEGLAARGGADEESEAERLRAELMKRLRAIDARRGSGLRLFENAASAGIA